MTSVLLPKDSILVSACWFKLGKSCGLVKYFGISSADCQANGHSFSRNKFLAPTVPETSGYYTRQIAEITEQHAHPSQMKSEFTFVWNYAASRHNEKIRHNNFQVVFKKKTQLFVHPSPAGIRKYSLSQINL